MKDALKQWHNFECGGFFQQRHVRLEVRPSWISNKNQCPNRLPRISQKKCNNIVSEGPAGREFGPEFPPRFWTILRLRRAGKMKQVWGNSVGRDLCKHENYLTMMMWNKWGVIGWNEDSILCCPLGRYQNQIIRKSAFISQNLFVCWRWWFLETP